jgi:hypothetical protein
MIKKPLFLRFAAYIICITSLVLFPVGCSTDCHGPRTDIPDLPFVEDSLSLENICRGISLQVLSRLGGHSTGSADNFYRTLDKTADSLIVSLGNKTQTLAGMNAILDVVYKKWNMSFSPCDDAFETALPHEAFDRRKGNCLGVSLMILMLAQRLGCPVYGVVLPGHFFCRFDNGEVRENIEPNKGGYRRPDDYYRTKYLSRGVPWYDLKNLTKKETAGVLYYSLGTIFLKKNDPGFAAACLQEGCRLSPFLTEAQGNYALALALCGRGEKALAVFDELFGKYPSFANLAANYGAVAMATGRYRKALDVYKKGLSCLPADPILLLGYSRAYAACSKADSCK